VCVWNEGRYLCDQWTISCPCGHLYFKSYPLPANRVSLCSLFAKVSCCGQGPLCNLVLCILQLHRVTFASSFVPNYNFFYCNTPDMRGSTVYVCSMSCYALSYICSRLDNRECELSSQSVCCSLGPAVDCQLSVLWLGALLLGLDALAALAALAALFRSVLSVCASYCFTDIFSALSLCLFVSSLCAAVLTSSLLLSCTLLCLLWSEKIARSGSRVVLW